MMMVCVLGWMVVVIDIVVWNIGVVEWEVWIGLLVVVWVIWFVVVWFDVEFLLECDSVFVDGDWFVFVVEDDVVWSVQGLVGGLVVLSGVVDVLVGLVILEFDVGIGGNGCGGDFVVMLLVLVGGVECIGYVQVVGFLEVEVVEMWMVVVVDVLGVVWVVVEFWNWQLCVVFDLDDDEFFGVLFVLEIVFVFLCCLYWWVVLGVIWFCCDFVGNVFGWFYDMFMLNYWGIIMFIWDYSFSLVSYVLFDFVEMCIQVWYWILFDIYLYFGIFLFIGGLVGCWYLVNDYVMMCFVYDYVCFMGDVVFFDEVVVDEMIVVLVWYWVIVWKDLWQDSVFVDYGEIDNFFECVSLYMYEVVGFNVVNVWSMCIVVDFVDLQGDEMVFVWLCVEVDVLLLVVIDCYFFGMGVFIVGQFDGIWLFVWYCYDFSVVGIIIVDDLVLSVCDEMVVFFQCELQIENWMCVFLLWDLDVSYSVCFDYQWNGVYFVWLVDVGCVFVVFGVFGVFIDWIEGLLCIVNQGLMGQVYFVEEVVLGIYGGVCKVFLQLLYIIDWVCFLFGVWIEFVIEVLFGILVVVDGMVCVVGCVVVFDLYVLLCGLWVGMCIYDIDVFGGIIEVFGW